ncbi:MAG: hypothetical protein IPL61_29890 [Myxococcales bacterium]|nr:hypothetical protein [Myxococcales bacterium]
MKSLRACVLLAAIVGSLAACGGDDAGAPIDAGADAADVDAAVPDAAPGIDAAVFPPLRNPVSMGDLALARAASERLGVGTSKACDQCHALTRDTFTRWLAETQVADACLTTLAPGSAAEARTILDCFRSATGQPYDPRRLGIYTTGAPLAWFDAVMQLGYGAGAPAELAEWSTRVVMPRGAQPLLTQAEFDVVAEWFARGLPQLDAVINDIPPPDGCTQDIQPGVATHVTAMQTAGWTALNTDDGLLMFGCAGATTPQQCLATFPASTAYAWSSGWGTAAPSSTLRVLHQYDYRSSFWTRSSADGRFVAHGGGATGGSTVIDLQTGREIRAAASYDPGFFPDNSGFVIQGGAKPWCRQSLLTSNPASITFNEPECSNVSVVGLYQHVGAVRGGDYWAVAGQFVSDNGGGEPSASFGASGHSDLTPMVWSGTAYSARPEVVIQTPYEGDTIISPSAKLLLSRTSFNGAQSGFTLRRVDATFNGTSYDVAIPIIGRYCVQGGKPAFSYDERWIVYHHWVQAADWSWMGYPSATDPAFQALVSAGTANIFLLDITTGVTTRITSMNAGQTALFPHFRSDGWIYFIVKDDATPNHEVVVASDAALVAP